MPQKSSVYIYISLGVRGEKNGAISVCKLFSPRCLLSINSSLMLIGEGPELKALRLTTGMSYGYITFCIKVISERTWLSFLSLQLCK